VSAKYWSRRQDLNPRPADYETRAGEEPALYCAAMSTINYNSLPQAPEVMLESDGTLRLLRRRQPSIRSGL